MSQFPGQSCTSRRRARAADRPAPRIHRDAGHSSCRSWSPVGSPDRDADGGAATRRASRTGSRPARPIARRAAIETEVATTRRAARDRSPADQSRSETPRSGHDGAQAADRRAAPRSIRPARCAAERSGRRTARRLDPPPSEHGRSAAPAARPTPRPPTASTAAAAPAATPASGRRHDISVAQPLRSRSMPDASRSRGCTRSARAATIGHVTLPRAGAGHAGRERRPRRQCGRAAGTERAARSGPHRQGRGSRQPTSCAATRVARRSRKPRLRRAALWRALISTGIIAEAAVSTYKSIAGVSQSLANLLGDRMVEPATITLAPPDVAGRSGRRPAPEHLSLSPVGECLPEEPGNSRQRPSGRLRPSAARRSISITSSRPSAPTETRRRRRHAGAARARRRDAGGARLSGHLRRSDAAEIPGKDHSRHSACSTSSSRSRSRCSRRASRRSPRSGPPCRASISAARSPTRSRSSRSRASRRAPSRLPVRQRRVYALTMRSPQHRRGLRQPPPFGHHDRSRRGGRDAAARRCEPCGARHIRHDRRRRRRHHGAAGRSHRRLGADRAARDRRSIRCRSCRA